MTNETYRPKKLEDALARIAEECSEVIKIVCKAQRFGLNDFHPQKMKRNIELLLEELADVKTAQEDFLTILKDCNPTEKISLKDFARKTLNEKMHDPKYWRDKDPQIIKEVEQGFKDLYG